MSTSFMGTCAPLIRPANALAVAQKRNKLVRKALIGRRADDDIAKPPSEIKQPRRLIVTVIRAAFVYVTFGVR
jgi:hypothetical protein